MQNFDRLEEQLLHAGLRPRPPGDPTGWVKGSPLLPSFDWIRPAFRDPPRFQPEYFSLYGDYVLLIAGSSEEHSEKRWPLENYIKIATWLADNNITPVIIGGKAEGDIGMKIVRAEQRAKSLIGRTDLFQLATLSERALMAIGGDTGPMHLAAAAGAPGICLFAQDWNRGMEMELTSVWNPQTRLGRAAPRGSHMFVLYAPTLEKISVHDVQNAAVRLGVLPEGVEAPPPPEQEPEEAEDSVGYDDPDADNREPSAAQEFAESDDS